MTSLRRGGAVTTIERSFVFEPEGKDGAPAKGLKKDRGGKRFRGGREWLTARIEGGYRIPRPSDQYAGRSINQCLPKGRRPPANKEKTEREKNTSRDFKIEA